MAHYSQYNRNIFISEDDSGDESSNLKSATAAAKPRENGDCRAILGDSQLLRNSRTAYYQRYHDQSIDLDSDDSETEVEPSMSIAFSPSLNIRKGISAIGDLIRSRMSSNESRGGSMTSIITSELVSTVSATVSKEEAKATYGSLYHSINTQDGASTKPGHARMSNGHAYKSHPNGLLVSWPPGRNLSWPPGRVDAAQREMVKSLSSAVRVGSLPRRLRSTTCLHPLHAVATRSAHARTRSRSHTDDGFELLDDVPHETFFFERQISFLKKNQTVAPAAEIVMEAAIEENRQYDRMLTPLAPSQQKRERKKHGPVHRTGGFSLGAVLCFACAILLSSSVGLVVLIMWHVYDL